jgi:hypothetical protein
MTDAEAPDRPAEAAVANDSTTGPAAPRTDPVVAHERALRREKEQFSGMRFWLAFFGWLTATGLTVVLLALITAIGALFRVQDLLGLQQSAQAVGIGGAVALLVVLLIAYSCGGYVAGRMARFSGLKQGLAVWLWAVIVAVLLGIAGAIAGTSTGAVGRLGSVAQLPLSPSTLTVAGIVTAVAVLVATLVGALLDGLAGMRYHRRVDRSGLEV